MKVRKGHQLYCLHSEHYLLHLLKDGGFVQEETLNSFDLGSDPKKD